MLLRSGALAIFAVLACGVACSSSDSGSSGNADGKGGAGGAGSGPIFDDPNGGGGGAGSLSEGGLDDLRKAACAGATEGTEALPSVIQFVIDTSGSMGQNAPGSNASKWAETRDALGVAIDSLPASTAVGILYYPNEGTDPSTPNGDETDPERPVTACVNTDALLPIDLLGPRGSAHRTDIQRSLDRIRPDGGTPTHDAYRVALDPLRNTTFPGSRFMVLITDGQPTFLSGCRGTGNVVDPVDPRPIVDEVAAAAGIQTFVIGSPGSEAVGVPIFADARTWLSQAASRGGTARPNCSDDGPNFCHFDMSQERNFGQALQNTLKLIVGAVLSCSYPLPTPSNGATLDPSKVNVILSADGAQPEVIPKAADNTCGGDGLGWRYSDDGAGLEFCQATCDRLKSEGSPKLDILFGCSTVGDPR